MPAMTKIKPDQAPESKSTDENRWIVRRPMKYDGAFYDQGQYITLKNLRNDERLIRLGFVREIRKGDDGEHVCAECGATFAHISQRTGHGDRHHKKRNLTPVQEDQLAEKELERLNREAPLNLEKTVASQNG